MTDNKTGLELLREPFPANQVSKLPKPTKRQTEDVKADFKKGVRCTECGGWHHPQVVHLDYVGHAALTDRLLEADPLWNWAPVGQNENGLPAFDNVGGLWIKLTVCGQTRLGYGHAGDKKGGDAIKEVIGDALRNAAMRFGAALDLWHKGDLHSEDDGQAEPAQQHDNRNGLPDGFSVSSLKKEQGTFVASLADCQTQEDYAALVDGFKPTLQIIVDHLPDWWRGTPNCPGLKATMEQACERVKQKEAA